MGKHTAANALGSQQIRSFLDQIGKAEQQRQEKQQLNAILESISGGGATIQDIVAAAQGETRFDKGLGGLFQRFSAGTVPEPGRIGKQIQEGVISEELKRLLSPGDAFDPSIVPKGLVPSGFSISQSGKKTRSFARPFVSPPSTKDPEKIRLANQKKVDKAIETLEDVTLSPVQRERARITLRNKKINTDAREATPGRDFTPEIRGKIREVVDRTGKNDKAFSEKAFNETLKEIKDEALSEGFTEDSVEKDFIRWWDEQVAKEAGQTFIKFNPRSKFQKGVKEVKAPPPVEKLAGDTPEPTTQEAYDAIPSGVEFKDTDGKIKVKK